jgi:hypothetical protein
MCKERWSSPHALSIINIKTTQWSQVVNYATACLISHLSPVLDAPIRTVYASGLVFNPLSLCLAQDIAFFAGYLLQQVAFVASVIHDLCIRTNVTLLTVRHCKTV